MLITSVNFSDACCASEKGKEFAIANSLRHLVLGSEVVQIPPKIFTQYSTFFLPRSSAFRPHHSAIRA